MVHIESKILAKTLSFGGKKPHNNNQHSSSIIVTGGGSGIGLGIVEECMTRHSLQNSEECRITLVDTDIDIDTHTSHITNTVNVNVVIGDVRDTETNVRMTSSHVSKFGSLDAVVLNAGVGETDDFILSATEEKWKECLDVNLVGVMEGVRASVQAMIRTSRSSPLTVPTIMVVASAGGVWPMTYSPVYSVSKAGCVMLVKALGPSLWEKYGIRLVGVCPQFVDTALGRRGRRLDTTMANRQMLSVSSVCGIMMDILDDDTTQSGDVVVILQNGIVRTVPSAPALGPVIRDMSMPRVARKIVVYKKSHKFREASRIEDYRIVMPTPPGHVLVKNMYCGVNASDVNFSAGKYHNGNPPLPMDAGFEGVGVVVAGDAPRGQPVAFLQYGGFAEYVQIPRNRCFKAFEASPEIVALLTSGLTASIALEQAAKVTASDTVLITAAAGGTGQFFVQLAKRAGAYVIATCGSDEKANMLKHDLGVDVVINYKTQDVGEALKKRRISLVIELVGGDMFDTALKALDIGGRLVIIGAMSQYSSGWNTPHASQGLPERLLTKNQSMIGFFLLNYATHFQRHFDTLQKLYQQGELKVSIDAKALMTCQGIDGIYNAIDLLQSGESRGKVVVKLSTTDDVQVPSKL
jgi:NADPH:quinone reductase-like Zn-dependent oxidoreductase/short-subunit dehydrogenase involved in D-alanine esterification of teichoic acids